MCTTNKITFLVILAFFLIAQASAGKIIYVDDDVNGLNDGSSWENAYTFLQDALADANSSEKPIEIRVAKGIYKPDQGLNQAAGDYRVSFRLINEVTVKGGYVGFGEADPNHRDIEAYKTILSGDLNGDDVDVDDPCDLFDERTRVGNSRNVVVGSNTDATAVLDGFTITGGRIWVIPSGRIGGSPAGGAGMLISSGSPTLINCTFTANVTNNYGGGLLLYNDSNPTLLNCKFIRNYAVEGGGIYNHESNNPILLNCVFSDNYARYGGGMLNLYSNPILTNCTFSRNSASKHDLHSFTTDGGGMLNRCSNPILTNCTFSDNSADNGGGMSNNNSSSLKLTNCSFRNNTAERFGGGGMYNNDVNDTILTGCLFYGNSVELNGGGMFVYNSNTTLVDCIFAGNKAKRNGGGVSCASSVITLLNCTVSGNRAGSRGGGISFGIFVARKISNSILYGNMASNGNEIAIITPPPGVGGCGGGTLEITHSIVGSDPNDTYFTYCKNYISGEWLQVDALFAQPGFWDPNGTPDNTDDDFWIDGDYHLKSQAGRWDPKTQSWVIDDVTSPGIDAGDPNSPIGFEPFPNGGRINIGAYGGTVVASKSYFGEPLCETVIPGDINGDCKVDFKDFVIMASHWFEER